MRQENGDIEGDITVDGLFKLNGTIDGRITIVSGGKLDLNGTCRGDVFIEENGALNLHGTVEGDIYNQGGKLEILGTHKGTLKEKV